MQVWVYLLFRGRTIIGFLSPVPETMQRHVMSEAEGIWRPLHTLHVVM